MSDEVLEMGPVDIVVIGFPPDAPRTGEAIPIFVDLVDRGIIRVLDVLVVQKDEQGTVSGLAIADLDGDGANDLLLFEGAQTGMLGDEDADMAGEALEPGEAAVLICFENAWAGPFAAAVRRNGGAAAGLPAGAHAGAVRRHPVPRRRLAIRDRERETSMPLLRRVARVAAVGAVAGGAPGPCSTASRARWAQQEEQQMAAQQQQQAAAAPPPPQEDPMEKLKELGSLHESGVLTDEEFAAAKAKILN